MPAVVLRPALLFVTLLAAGCDTESIRVVERIDAGVVDVTLGSEGCNSPQVKPGYAISSIDIDGATRTYGLFVPDGDVRIPRPLVFGFEGHGTAAACRDALALETPADGAAVFVYPENEPDANGDRSWITTDPSNRALFDALAAMLKQKACVSTVFVAGFGSGASMSNSLGCVRGSVVRGIAPLSGGWGATTDSGCEGDKVAVFLTHGDLDMTVSPVMSLDHWRLQNSCGTTSRPVEPAPCVSYNGCDPSFPVTLCEFDGDHVIPPWAPDAVWAFFAGLH